jgi:hypothetical protein
MMLERQREGIAKAKGEGKYRGRAPTAKAKAADVLRLAGKGMFARDDRRQCRDQPRLGLPHLGRRSEARRRSVTVIRWGIKLLRLRERRSCANCDNPRSRDPGRNDYAGNTRAFMSSSARPRLARWDALHGACGLWNGRHACQRGHGPGIGSGQIALDGFRGYVNCRRWKSSSIRKRAPQTTGDAACLLISRRVWSGTGRL